MVDYYIDVMNQTDVVAGIVAPAVAAVVVYCYYYYYYDDVAAAAVERVADCATSSVAVETIEVLHRPPIRPWQFSPDSGRSAVVRLSYLIEIPGEDHRTTTMMMMTRLTSSSLG